jgi:very-short-patch-repair endonuclease
MRGTTREIDEAAVRLRRRATDAEERLWKGLRGWRIAKFRRQHPIDRFVLDFYCPSARLCVELDGNVHDGPVQAERDHARSAALAVLGIHVIRFSNAEVLTDTRSVLRRIQAAVNSLPPVGES